jgi:hypothetical protein
MLLEIPAFLEGSYRTHALRRCYPATPGEGQRINKAWRQEEDVPPRSEWLAMLYALPDLVELDVGE